MYGGKIDSDRCVNGVVFCLRVSEWSPISTIQLLAGHLSFIDEHAATRGVRKVCGPILVFLCSVDLYGQLSGNEVYLEKWNCR